MNFMRPLVYLRSLQNTDPFEGTQKEKACLQYVLGLQTDPNEFMPFLFYVIPFYIILLLCHGYFTL